MSELKSIRTKIFEPVIVLHSIVGFLRTENKMVVGISIHAV